VRANLLVLLASSLGCSEVHRGEGVAPRDGDPPVANFATSDPRHAAPICVAGSSLIYFITAEQDLYRFDPAALTFTRVGPVRCDVDADTIPETISVDRYGTAWVQFSNNRLYHVSTTDASCAPTAYVPHQFDTTLYDLAFAADVPSQPGETLYASLESERGIARIDTDGLKLTVIGRSTDPLYDNAFALTGTEDARLFGLFALPVGFTIAEIDKYSGRLLAMKELRNIYTTFTWAWAFWGGVFWVFTTNGDPTSDITVYDPRDGSISTVARDIGFNITAAGTSTCAPIM
jgi:hypothetical protein